VVGDPTLPSCESLGRLDVESEGEDCRRFERGDFVGSRSGRMTAEAIGLNEG
jgi:hypothetical protein